MVAQHGITITWLGHATTKIETADGTVILIDAWLEHNPATPDDL
ncbi:MAG: MBL fold metallo-hydrolase [Chloroflexota bacterium]|nr:MBL fold metallo-hydrolase [Chloroflexota bacterium]